MADLGAYYTGTVVVGAPVTLDVAEDTPSKSIYYKVKHYRIDVTGTGSLKVETKAIGQAAFNDQGTFSGETVLLDMVAVGQIKLTASSADVPTSIAPYTE